MTRYNVRSNFSISSQEIRDRVYIAQDHMVYLLGYREDGVISGLYDRLEASGTAMYADVSGIPYMDDEGILDPLIAEGLEDNYKAAIYHNIPRTWRA